jgi:hypothetical protein
MARVLQIGKARRNGWKEVTERAGSEVHNSRDLEENKDYQTKKFNQLTKLKGGRKNV